MIETLLIKAGIVVGVLLGSFLFGYFKGKEHQRNKQLKKGVGNALVTQKRRSKRLTDSDTVINKRMRKYARR
ncbi:MAG: hypothetical protein ACTSXQ_07420 [Alphaproteobacteria bacterium]